MEGSDMFSLKKKQHDSILQISERVAHRRRSGPVLSHSQDGPRDFAAYSKRHNYDSTPLLVMKPIEVALQSCYNEGKEKAMQLRDSSHFFILRIHNSFNDLYVKMAIGKDVYGL